jgi:hypothetical protein
MFPNIAFLASSLQLQLYTARAATVLSSSVITRSIFGCVMPLVRLIKASSFAEVDFLQQFARQMYERLGVPWATSLLGFIAILLAPIPFIFRVGGVDFRNLPFFLILIRSITAHECVPCPSTPNDTLHR